MSLNKPTDEQRMWTGWAAATLTRKGATLYSHADGWDVEMPDGSWRGCSSAAELSAAAKELIVVDFA